MKRLFMVVLLGVLLMSACLPQATPTAQPPQPTASTAISVTDALGRQVVLPNSPRRIVVTGKAMIMVVDAVYMFPEASARIAALGDAWQGTSNLIAMMDSSYTSKVTLKQDAAAEQIAAAQPDLVILKSYLSETVGKGLDALKIPVIYVDFETPEQYQRDITILGKVFQNEARARQVVDFYQNKVAEIQSALQGVTNKPRTLLLYFSEKDGAVAFNVPPMAWMQTKMVQLAGGEPVWASANPGSGWTKVSLEQIAAWDADMVFIISYNKNSSEVVASLKTNPQWQALRATKEGRLYGFPADLYSWDQPDARWILGLTWLAGRLHPERLSKMDIVQQAVQFYQTLYGLDSAFFEKNIRPTFKGDLP